jgi:hypothetical protein
LERNSWSQTRYVIYSPTITYNGFGPTDTASSVGIVAIQLLLELAKRLFGSATFTAARRDCTLGALAQLQGPSPWQAKSRSWRVEASDTRGRGRSL